MMSVVRKLEAAKRRVAPEFGVCLMLHFWQ